MYQRNVSTSLSTIKAHISSDVYVEAFARCPSCTLAVIVIGGRNGRCYA